MEPQVAEAHDPPDPSFPHSRTLTGYDPDKGQEDRNPNTFDFYGEFTDPYRESQW
jgi:hypothetical protein